MYIIKVNSKIPSGLQLDMKTSVRIAIIILFAGAWPVFAQRGGKAEPNRIEFASGKSGIVLTGTLSNAQEMEYVFATLKGQKVTIKMSPKGIFDFRIFSEEFEVETEFDDSPDYALDIQETGDYKLFVRKKMVQLPRSAKFYMTVIIK